MLQTAPVQTDVDRFREDAAAMQAALDRVMIGQAQVVQNMVTALLAGGHVLLEGLPGLGKTQLAKGAAAMLGEPLARVQGTPDLMPFDIVGSDILQTDADGRTRLEFSPGPIFTTLLLLDEINRTPPKTQSALLEAMQEGQVSAGGQTRALPDPFIVLATQNTIEFEGTYPLPEAQLDRFMMKIDVPYPSRAALIAMAAGHLSGNQPKVIDRQRLLEMRALARAVAVGDHMIEAAVDLVLATHPGPEAAPEVREAVAHGASPRALQALLLAGSVHALRQGRAHLSLGDLEAVALPVLGHRVLLDFGARLEGVTCDDVLREVLSGWRQRAAGA